MMIWHARILQLMEQNAMYDRINWDPGGEENKAVSVTPVEGFLCTNLNQEARRGIFISSLVYEESACTQRYNGVAGPLRTPAVGINEYRSVGQSKSHSEFAAGHGGTKCCGAKISDSSRSPNPVRGGACLIPERPQSRKAFGSRRLKVPQVSF